MVEASPISYEPRRALLAGIASIVTVTALIIIKAIAFAFSGSTSVLAALIDSISDAAGSAVNLLAIHISLKPADNHHRYGHGKVEGLAALFQALLIAMASFYLVVNAIEDFNNPASVEGHGLGIVVMVASIILSMVLVAIQKASLRYAPSLAVEADQAHYGSDIAVNIVVLLTLGAQYYGAPGWVDPLVAIAIGLWLLRTSWGVAKGGLDMLLDREISDAERIRIVECVRKNPEVRGVHDLRTRMTGMSLHISFDIEVDADLNLRDAHAIAHKVEACLLTDFPHAEIMIHVDPEGQVEDARHSPIGFRPIG